MKSIAVNAEQLQKVKTSPGFIAALDQSGGSTPKALRLYGVQENTWSSDEEMFAIVHQMRTRIITSPAFNGDRIISANLVPIIEPEIDIHCPEKGKAEQLLKAAILEKVNQLPDGQFVMLKLTLPEQDNFYAEFVKHPRVLRVVALSGGYSREEANNRLRKNHGVVASFSRARVEGLTAQQSDAEFNAMLDKSIQCIFDASNS